MPMVPQAMFTMLACARIGAPHSLIFGGFASKELSVRIDHAKVSVALHKVSTYPLLNLPSLEITLVFFFPAQIVGHSVLRGRARPKGGLHSSGGESAGAEQPQTLQNPHLQSTGHGEKITTPKTPSQSVKSTLRRPPHTPHPTNLTPSALSETHKAPSAFKTNAHETFIGR